VAAATAVTVAAAVAAAPAAMLATAVTVTAAVTVGAVAASTVPATTAATVTAVTAAAGTRSVLRRLHHEPGGAAQPVARHLQVALTMLGASVPAEPFGHRALPFAAAGPHHLV
jgi:hypothetical protein